MCYRCEVCEVVIPHKTPLLKYTMYRIRGNSSHQEIAGEIKVCNTCHQLLSAKMDIKTVRKGFQSVSSQAAKRIISSPPLPSSVSVPNGKGVSKDVSRILKDMGKRRREQDN